MVKLIASADINGAPVAFFEPPHHEPDFLWVDGLQLARAFLPRAVADVLFEAVMRNPQRSGARRVRAGGRMVVLISHPITQGLCSAIDLSNGDGEDGPAFNTYCRAAARLHQKHWPLGLSGLLAAAKNAGGPALRARTDGEDA